MNKILRILFPMWYLFFELNEIGQNPVSKNELKSLSIEDSREKKINEILDIKGRD